jgi:hypothetical protein
MNTNIKQLIGAALAICASASVSYAQTIADSVADFSSTQGQSNWYYGYYVSPFSSSTFRQLEMYITEQYGWTGWQHTNHAPPWTGIDATIMHPATPVASFIPTEWAVRRWQSPYTGIITVSGTIRKNLVYWPSEDGVTGRIIVDGIQVCSLPVAPGDQVGYGFSVDAAVTNGSFVDLALSPNENDGNDGTVFMVTIKPAEPCLSIRVSQVELCWLSRTNKVYQLQYRSTLTTNVWTNLGTSLPGDGSALCTYDAVAPGEPRRFYRVVVSP